MGSSISLFVSHGLGIGSLELSENRTLRAVYLGLSITVTITGWAIHGPNPLISATTAHMINAIPRVGAMSCFANG